MGKRTEYPHGTFSFADVMTTDVDGAKSFYSEKQLILAQKTVGSPDLAS